MRVAPRAVQDWQFSRSAKFTAAHRLSRRDGFDHVFSGESISDRHFKFFLGRNQGRNARLGMIVGKKKLARAVDRNRMKRVIREAFRRHSINRRNVDLVVMVRRAVSSQETGALAGELKMLFNLAESRCAQ